VLLAFATKPSPRAAEVFNPRARSSIPTSRTHEGGVARGDRHDAVTGTVKPFKVQVVNGIWSIRPIYNYPADGKERLKNTAGAVMDLRKERIASLDPQAARGVSASSIRLIPRAKGTQGRGKRVRLFDASGTALADYIFGKGDAGRLRQSGTSGSPTRSRRTVIKAQPDITGQVRGTGSRPDLLQIGSASVRKGGDRQVHVRRDRRARSRTGRPTSSPATTRTGRGS
jgi:hypothetical protein